MPLVHVTTSAEIPAAEARDLLLKELSRILCQHFGKPEKWVMVALAPRAEMLFAGSAAPACYLEVKNIGRLPDEGYRALSASLCARIKQDLGVELDRIYIEFSDAARPLWGWNGSTLD